MNNYEEEQVEDCISSCDLCEKKFDIKNGYLGNTTTECSECSAMFCEECGDYGIDICNICDKEEEEQVEVNCICDKCFGEGTTWVSAERAKELKEMELMEECCPYGDKCNAEEDDEEEYFGECNNCGIEANDLQKCGNCELIYCLQCQMEGLCDCCYEILKEEEEDDEGEEK